MRRETDVTLLQIENMTPFSLEIGEPRVVTSFIYGHRCYSLLLVKNVTDICINATTIIKKNTGAS